MDRLLNESCNPRELSTAALAFVGDAVYSLMVREQLACSSRSGADVLHKRAVEQVRCKAQSEAIRRVQVMLTVEEQAVFNRGRNAHTSHVPKNAAVADYRAATGVETLFGYIYMCGRIDRLRELFAAMQEPYSAEN